MSLDDLKEQIAEGAHKVTDMAGRLKEGFDESRERHRLDHELDLLFTELGIEVYQRMRADEPVESSVVVQDLIDRIAAVELELSEHDPSEHDASSAE